MGMAQTDVEGARQQLWRIAGEWVTDGHVVGDPPVPVRGTDTYEVLEGGHFLVHHVDVTVGDHEVRAIEVIGEPAPDGNGFLARSFDDQGNAELMQVVVVDDGVLRFTGGPEVARAAQPPGATPARVHATLTVAPDGRSMTARWERSEDGHGWERWMDIGFTRR